MAVGLSEPKKLLAIEGIKLATTNASIRYHDRDDMVLITVPAQGAIAAVFTQNKFCAAPVLLAKEYTQHAHAQALLINAGNANAGTGKQGLANAKQNCELVAEKLSLEKNQVLPFSTGVIGEQLPMSKLISGIGSLTTSLAKDRWIAAAKAIMTTDTVAKGVSVQVELDAVLVTITGIAKGSGMICPNMATLLAYVATDAKVSKELLQKILEKTNEASFNRITVDSDTSTNDSLVLMASGAAEMSQINASDDPRYDKLYQAVEQVMIALSTAVIRDGEGATKFVKVSVSNGASEHDCEQVAYTVAHSPLVKTALFASDPNWGRILAAIGRAPIDTLVINKVSIQVNEVALIENGEPAESYTEEKGQAVFDQEEIEIAIDLGVGDAAYHVWTSDLSHDYVSINADYRS